MEKVILFLLVMGLTGCSSVCPVKIETVPYSVPVIVKPAPPPKIERPSLSSPSMSLKTDGYDKYTKELELDLNKLEGYILQLEEIINKYKEASQ